MLDKKKIIKIKRLGRKPKPPEPTDLEMLNIARAEVGKKPVKKVPLWNSDKEIMDKKRKKYFKNHSLWGNDKTQRGD